MCGRITLNKEKPPILDRTHYARTKDLLELIRTDTLKNAGFAYQRPRILNHISILHYPDDHGVKNLSGIIPIKTHILPEQLQCYVRTAPV